MNFILKNEVEDCCEVSLTKVGNRIFVWANDYSLLCIDAAGITLIGSVNSSATGIATEANGYPIVKKG